MSKDHLLSLIQSLTKSEKRNFKLYTRRLQSNEDVKFVRLFDLLDKMDDYDDSALLRKMRISNSQLANLKRHLYSQILKSLRLIHSEKNVEMQIREQIDHARILYEKGLYLQALRLLERTKAVADRTHQDILRLDIVEFQKYIEERHITRSRRIEGKMERLLDESDMLEHNVSNMVRLSSLKIKIHGLYITMGFARNEKDHYMVKEYFHAEIGKIREERLSVMEQVYLAQCYMWYYYILLDMENCHVHASQWVRLFDDNPAMKKDDPVLYMRGLSYVLTTLYGMRKYKEYVRVLDEFEAFGSGHEKRFTTTQRIIHFLYINSARLNRHFIEGSFRDGLDLVPAIERQLKRYSRFIDVHRIMVFRYKIGWLYFGAGRYDKSIDSLNKIINLKAGHLREDLQCYARLLHLMCHFELGHIELLEYQIEAVSRFFEKMQDLNEIQKTILDFFRRSISVHEVIHKKDLKELRMKVNALSEDAYERRAFQHLDILAWIDSKIKDKPLAGIVQENFRKA